MSYFPNAQQGPSQDDDHDGPRERWSRLLPPITAAVGGAVVAVPLVLIATAALSEDSRPAAQAPANADQSLLGQVPYGSH